MRELLENELEARQGGQPLTDAIFSLGARAGDIAPHRRTEQLLFVSWSFCFVCNKQERCLAWIINCPHHLTCPASLLSHILHYSKTDT